MIMKCALLVAQIAFMYALETSERPHAHRIVYSISAESTDAIQRAVMLRTVKASMS
jgi:hypothetical protein